MLNYLCPDDPTYVVFATSNLARFQKAVHLRGEIVEINPNDYAFLNRPTALDFTDIKTLTLDLLGRLHAAGSAVVVGQLLPADMTRCDELIRRSRFIAPRILHLILPGDYK